MPKRFAASILCLAFWTAPIVAADPSDGDKLIEATQRQEVSTVRELLAADTDVNAKSRYGATSLFFACDKGNVELVKLLLEHGAEVDVTDTFYNATPLTWTLFGLEDSPAHREIALLLLKRNPADASAAVGFGIRGSDLELVKAAVATNKVTAGDLRSSLQSAEANGETEIAEYLRSKAPAEDETTVFEVSAEKLATYVGNYANQQVSMRIQVFLDGEEFKIQAEGQPALALVATGKETFKARDFPGISLTFRGRGGLVEGFILHQGGQDLDFPRAEAAKPEVVETAELPPLPPAERSAPIHWPRFRGTDAAGIGDGQGVPETWDGASGKNVRWKTRVPGLGHSSPVIWGDKIFITTAVSEKGDESLRTGLYGDVDSVDDDSSHSWKVYALSRTGEILWEHTAASGQPKEKRHLKSTLANPTPATDGEYLVVHFGSEGLFCYDLDGNLKWRQEQGTLSSGWFYDATYEWGFSSSPIIHDGKAIVQVDVQKGSFVAAYDLATGKEAWRTAREEIPTWGTPAVLPSAGEGAWELVTNGTTVRGYDVATGKELWRLGPNSEVTVGSPVIADGVAYITGGYPPVRPIYAVKPGGRGDMTLPEEETSSPHVLWSTSRGGTYIPTPIVYRGILYMLHNNGRLTAHDAATGEQLYRERVGKAASYSASTVAADGRLFMTSEEGVTTVVRAGKVYQELAVNTLGEVVMTTPAISDGLMVVRGAQHVYGLGTPSSESSETSP